VLLKSHVPAPKKTTPTARHPSAPLGFLIPCGRAKMIMTWPNMAQAMDARMVFIRTQQASARYPPMRGVKYAQKRLNSIKPMKARWPLSREPEWVTSKQAKLRALSLLACNFGHLELAGLACLTEIIWLACLLDRLIDFV